MKVEIEWYEDKKFPMTCPACNRSIEVPVRVLEVLGNHECPHCGTVLDFESE